jgi:hypothetical protein
MPSPMSCMIKVSLYLELSVREVECRYPLATAHGSGTARAIQNARLAR